MDPNDRKLETVVACRPVFTDEELADAYRAAGEADARDGTLDFIEGVTDDFLDSEPDDEW